MAYYGAPKGTRDIYNLCRAHDIYVVRTTYMSCARHNSPRILDAQDNHHKFVEKNFSQVRFRAFSRAFFPPFQWAHMSQKLGICSFPLTVFFPKNGAPPTLCLGVIPPRSRQEISRFS